MRRWIFIGICLGISALCLHAADTLDQQFTQTVTPFLASYCVGCHSGSAPAGQFDLKAYSSVSSVVRDFAHWNLVIEKLTAGQMPPKGAKQPAAEVRQAVTDWVLAVRANEARAHAGDPGPVLARRLSNSE